MTRKKYIFILILIGFIFSLNIVNGQGKIYEGPDDSAGDIAAERIGQMTGNRVFLSFRNNTELSDWPNPNVSSWPSGPDGTKMLGGVGLLLGAKVYIKNDNNPATVDTIPETNLDLIKSSPEDYHELYYLQTSYREEMDTDPSGTVEWGLYPVFGYFNSSQIYPAMSNRPSSWPIDGWPSSGFSTKWPGEWDGRFGRGVIYADLETYFVVNDAQDQEYLGREDFVKYYPRPGQIIGDINPDVTIGLGNPWGGLGLRVETRGFQWNNPQARDAIFWEYTIANISEYDIPEVAFGYWVDNAIGDDGSDELGFFDKTLDLAYSWDINGVGLGGTATGTMGFAYLESPGNSSDQIDNDNDGLIDEKRDNVAQTLIGPTDGISDLEAFLDFYRLEESDLKEHWDADEDQDWEDGEDLNNDGIYQLNEFAGDDIGLDGVGPGELNYFGPDEGEGNHRPDFVEGVGSEPNFAFTDVSESDMIGLTSFQLFPVPSHAQSSTTLWFKNDEAMFNLIAADTLEEYIGNISNLIETFASGTFPLFQGRTERISMSELHSYDPLTGLNSDRHTAPALYELKKIVQVIYEKDYRFAQPPKLPTLTATAGDGKVVLTWDNIADTKTRDPFVGNVNDFEGYKIYKSTDKWMTDPLIITDGYGSPTLYQPVFQCDLIDGIQGFTDFGLINGVAYNLGSDTGITHYFIDEDVQNGRTYYYAIVAYDYGAPDIGPGIAPSENNFVIEFDDQFRNIVGTGKNVAIAVPRQTAAGYVQPEINIGNNEDIVGNGTIIPSILAKGDLQDGHTYEVSFDIDTLSNNSKHNLGLRYTTSSIYINDLTDNELVYSETPDNYSAENLVYRDSLDYWTLQSGNEISTDVFDGMRLKLNIESEQPMFDPLNSGWMTGSAPIIVTPMVDTHQEFPWKYDIVFSSDQNFYQGVSQPWRVTDENRDRIFSADLLFNQSFNFAVLNRSFVDNTGNNEILDLVVHDVNGNGQFDYTGDRILAGALSDGNEWVGTVMSIVFTDGNDLPEANDVYRIDYKRPFFKTDKFTFTTVMHDSVNVDSLNASMKDIKVVPNPYIATNKMEESQTVGNRFLNQQRRIMFTNLPARCNIKIFTVSGVLVDEIIVSNSSDTGIAHWDLLSREGLEVAAGMYLYYVKSNETGEEVLGKFAIIK